MSVNNEFNSIWDSIAKSDNIRHTKIKIREIDTQIEELKVKCGSCQHWMKSSDCPIEKTCKPSMNHRICPQFKMEQWVSDFIAKQTEKSKFLTESLKNL